MDADEALARWTAVEKLVAEAWPDASPEQAAAWRRAVCESIDEMDRTSGFTMPEAELVRFGLELARAVFRLCDYFEVSWPTDRGVPPWGP